MENSIVASLQDIYFVCGVLGIGKPTIKMIKYISDNYSIEMERFDFKVESGFVIAGLIKEYISLN